MARSFVLYDKTPGHEISWKLLNILAIKIVYIKPVSSKHPREVPKLLALDRLFYTENLLWDTRFWPFKTVLFARI